LGASRFEKDSFASLIQFNRAPSDEKCKPLSWTSGHLERDKIKFGQPFDPEKVDEPTHKGLTRAALIGPKIMKWKAEVPLHAVSDSLEQSSSWLLWG
jgi:hypothetical protein